MIAAVSLKKEVGLGRKNVIILSNRPSYSRKLSKKETEEYMTDRIILLLMLLFIFAGCKPQIYVAEPYANEKEFLERVFYSLKTDDDIYMPLIVKYNDREKLLVASTHNLKEFLYRHFKKMKLTEFDSLCIDAVKNKKVVPIDSSGFYSSTDAEIDTLLFNKIKKRSVEFVTRKYFDKHEEILKKRVSNQEENAVIYYMWLHFEEMSVFDLTGYPILGRAKRKKGMEKIMPWD